MAAVESKKLIVTVLGSGTSQGVPMIGCRCPVCLSTDARDRRTRSSLHLETPSAKILVDATPDLRQQALRERLDGLDAVIFTHPHADHIMGFDDLRRFCEMRGGPLPIYGSEHTLSQIERIFCYAFNPKKTVPGYVHVVPHIVAETFPLGGLEVTPLPVPHGSIQTNGYLFSQGGRNLLAYLSDCAAVPEPVRNRIAGVEVLIIDGLREKGTSDPSQRARRGGSRPGYRGGKIIPYPSDPRKKSSRPFARSASGVEVAYDGMKLEFAWQ